MESATITTRTLEIDGMSGDACVQKVTGALKGVHGVSTQSVKVGTATIGADQVGCNAARAALGIAGYKSREAGGTAEGDSPGRATQKTPSGHKGGDQPCTPGQTATGASAGAANSGACGNTPAVAATA